jgi:hypothetical protein
MPPKAIFAKPTEQELAALPKAAHSGLVVTIQRSWIYDHAKKLLRHGVKELHVEIGPLVGKGKRTYWCKGQGEYSHILTQISSKHLGVAVQLVRGTSKSAGQSQSSGAIILSPDCTTHQQTSQNRNFTLY